MHFEGQVDSPDHLRGARFELCIRLRGEFADAALELANDSIGWIQIDDSEAQSRVIEGAVFCDIYLDLERFAELWLRGVFPRDPDTQLSIGLEISESSRPSKNAQVVAAYFNVEQLRIRRSGEKEGSEP